MNMKQFFYNSITVSLPKNIIQYLLGFVLFWLTYSYFDMQTFLFSVTGFVLAYSAVYFFNDVVDYEEDKKDKDKRAWKLVAGGMISRNTAIVLGLLFLVTGLLLSSMVSGWYLNIIALILFLNFIHSHPKIKLKKKLIPTTINMTVIEFFKYSSGWFAFTGDLTRFPFWIILTFSVVYSTIYIVYKFKFSGDMIRKYKPYFGVIAATVLVSYVLSLTLYSFALPLAILFLMSLSIVVFSVVVGNRFKFMNWLWIEFIIMPAMIMAFLIISIPFAAQANANLTEKIGEYKDTVYKELPENMAETLDNLSEPRYSSLDEIEDAINRSVNGTISSVLK